MDWSWAVSGVTNEVPRTTGPECMNYMTNRRRWFEAVVLTILFIFITRWAVKRLKPIVVPAHKQLDRPHSAIRLLLLIAMTFVFGIEMGYKLSEKTVIFVLNPCHIQTMVQIYLLAAKPSKTTIALFRIQMNNLNGPVLAFLFPEVECRTLPFEQAAYWIQHALLFIIPAYMLKSGAYTVEEFTDFNWVTIGVMIMLIYHFTVLNILSIISGINLNHMLCAAVADPFQGQNYRIAAVIHESILCPILNKVTVLLFSSKNSITYDTISNNKSNSINISSSSCSSLSKNANANDGDEDDRGISATVTAKTMSINKSNNMPLEKQKLQNATTINNQKTHDNTINYLYHQQQQQQQFQSQQHPQQQHKHETLPLTADRERTAMISGTSVSSSVGKQNFIKQRQVRANENLLGPDVVIPATTATATTTTTATILTADYTMPTTKID